MVQTAMDIYSHLYPNKQQEVARILNETIDLKSSDSAGYKKTTKCSQFIARKKNTSPEVVENHPIRG